MDSPSVRQKVGSFVLLEKLGTGGMGEVWKARDERLDRIVALKFILGGERNASRELAREAKAASALNHPNIITILEIGESGGSTYVAMEFVEGETLRARLDRSRLPFDKALDLVVQMARGLAAAHRHGIVHRDVKPENVMLRVDGYVKLVDFGLAKLLPWTGDSTRHASSAPTLTGQITGTFSYMSPEQARGHRVGPASDAFSFGIVLYEMLTGEHPFRADTPIDTLNCIISAEPVSTRVRLPELPPEIHGIVERCLEKDHTERFQSASDLEAELQRSPAAPGALKKRPRWWLAAAAVFLAVLLGIFIWMGNPRSSPAAGLAAVRSVAVMNFRVSSEDATTAALAQGLSEELGAALSREGFLVPPRSRNWLFRLPSMRKTRAPNCRWIRFWRGA